MRRRLLKSARRIFARDGFEAARIEDIAAHAGHTRGAFYAHFRTKEDLFFALLEEETREHLEKIEQLLGKCTSAAEQFDTLREYYVRRNRDRQLVMLFIEFKLFAIRRPKLRPKLAEIHRTIREVVKKEMIQRMVVPELWMDPAWESSVRSGLEGVLNGLVLENAFDPTRLSDDELAEMLRKLFNFLIKNAIPAKWTQG